MGEYLDEDAFLINRVERAGSVSKRPLHEGPGGCKKKMANQ